MRASVRGVGALICLGLAGCSSMLPRGTSVSASPFRTYESARDALNQVVPYKTTTEELKALGFDPGVSSNVTLIPYPDVVTRLAPNPGIPLNDLDPGVRDCILAQTRCHAYVFRFSQLRRVRQGNFWADFLNFRRTTEVTGWRFEGLVVVRNGVVLFRSMGGEPKIDTLERQVNPLGFLQPAGEQAGSLIH